jgi:chromate transport protein ChrA
VHKVSAWYITPCVVAILIHVSVIVRHAKPQDPILEPLSLGLAGIFLALLGWAVWAINRRSVRKQIEPRIAELETLRTDLLSPTE